MDIQDLHIFSRVAVVQRLSAVGMELGLTPGTISKRIQALELELRVRLFDRTTRSIRITEEGKTFLAHVERALHEIDSARAAVGINIERPAGKINIAAPSIIARRLLSPALLNFVNLYPEIDVRLDVKDSAIHLTDDGYDAAIMAGKLEDSTLIAKRLMPDSEIMVASPAYIAAHGAPATPADLTQHRCLVAAEVRQWSLRTRDGNNASIKVSGRLQSNSREFLLQAALKGHGILRVSKTCIEPELARSKFVRILEDWEFADGSDIWAVYPGSRLVLPKLRVLVDYLAENLKEASGMRARAARDAVSGKPREIGNLVTAARARRA
jgi:DNA-binding transcriptional LysR family regulator